MNSCPANLGSCKNSRVLCGVYFWGGKCVKNVAILLRRHSSWPLAVWRVSVSEIYTNKYCSSTNRQMMSIGNSSVSVRFVWRFSRQQNQEKKMLPKYYPFISHCVILKKWTPFLLKNVKWEALTHLVWRFWEEGRGKEMDTDQIISIHQSAFFLAKINPNKTDTDWWIA